MFQEALVSIPVIGIFASELSTVTIDIVIGISMGLIVYIIDKIDLFKVNEDKKMEYVTRKFDEIIDNDLTGEWNQVNNKSKYAYQAATISGDTIEIYWVSDNGDTKSLYWAGSFVAPTTADVSYKWDSKNDHSKTEKALLASNDDTKTMTYQDGVLSYQASAVGTTTTVKLEKKLTSKEAELVVTLGHVFEKGILFPQSYENGEGVKRNIKTALKWYEEAAKSGEKNAINALRRINFDIDNTTIAENEQEDLNLFLKNSIKIVEY